MLGIVIYLIYLILAAWTAVSVCKNEDYTETIDVIGVSILCLLWPIFFIGVMISVFGKGDKK